jgi:hypothetical protein
VSNYKFAAFLFLVLVWMPGIFCMFLWLLISQHLQGAWNFMAVIPLLYALFVPGIVFSFWDEFAKLARAIRGKCLGVKG